ncbi:MAG TPA: tetratricopeptide repeat protein [Longimicrobium sp.]|jgi:tetratricopeptide (TPR) repeat protein
MPDISPELAARIEQLRSSHDGNPSRFFMPLASAYREAGDLARAEELLRENLKRHPGYLSAHVLLGRCLADRGATEEARNEFGYVLSIDPQNLIALRTLGEMAASGGDQAEARRWYGELLAVDPMSAEARQALDSLDSAPAAAAAPDPSGGWDPFEHGGVASPEAVDSSFGEPAPAYGETRIDDGSFDEPELMDAPGFDVPATLEPSPELGFGGISLPPPAAAEEPAADLSGWGDVSLDEPFESPPAAAAPDALDFGTVDLTDDWSSAPAEPHPAADAGWNSFNDAPDEPVELRSFHDEDAVGEDEVEMVTETMAELYYRQGFVDRAADVYRELVARRGHEPALIGRLAELETELRNPAADKPAPASVQEEEAAPSWLDAVDAAMTGNAPPPLPGMSFADEPGTPPPLPMMSFAHDEPASDFIGAQGGETSADTFAESFANGFGGPAAETAPAEEAAPAYAAPFDAERDAWMPPTVEPTAPIEDAAFEMEPAFAAEPVTAQTDAEQGTEGSESVAAYLWSILSWRPGATASPAYESYATDVEPAAPAPLEYNPPDIEPEAGAPPPAEPWDDVTLGAAEEQPPLDEPWMADGAVESELTSANDEDEPWAVPAAPTEDILPPDDTAGAIDELPWLALDEPVAASEPDADQFAPPVEDFAPAGTEGAGDAADEPMPWEMALDLPPAAAEAAPAPAPAEPVGGFSFEDFFSEPAPAPAPPPAPAPQPAAPAAPAADAAADDDEDLESFQAWLQSLKR